jgi:ribonuclease P protein component
MDSQHRLNRVQDVERVRRLGRAYSHALMVLVAQPSDLAHPRFAFVAGKGVGGAVQRNRAKRRLRSMALQLAPQIEAGWDLVWIARKPAVAADWSALQQAAEGLLGRAGALRNG